MLRRKCQQDCDKGNVRCFMWFRLRPDIVRIVTCGRECCKLNRLPWKGENNVVVSPNSQLSSSWGAALVCHREMWSIEVTEGMETEWLTLRQSRLFVCCWNGIKCYEWRGLIVGKRHNKQARALRCCFQGNLERTDNALVPIEPPYQEMSLDSKVACRDPELVVTTFYFVID